MTRVLCVGECMIELTHIDPVTLRLGFAGDTYNAAVYLRRVATQLGHDAEAVTSQGSATTSTATRCASNGATRESSTGR